MTFELTTVPFPDFAVPMMMYGFGDSRNPDPATVETMEALVVSFLADLCHRCRPAPYSFPASRTYPYATRSKVKVDDLRFALRKDEKKLARLEELLYLEGVISGAKKIFSVDVVDDVARQVEAEEREQEREQRGAMGREGEEIDQQEQGGDGQQVNGNGNLQGDGGEAEAETDGPPRRKKMARGS